MVKIQKKTPSRAFVSFVFIISTVVGLALIAGRAHSTPALTSFRGSHEVGVSRRGPIAGPAASSLGLLYVVDSMQNAGTGQILVVDPSDGTTKRTISTGMSPDAVLSPDGTRLYVWSGEPDSNGDCLGFVLEEFDAKSSTLTRCVKNPDPFLTTNGVHDSHMLTSESGNWIYIMKYHLTTETLDIYLSVFDTVNHRLLPTHVSFPGCRYPLLLPTDEESTVDVACMDLPYVTEVVLTPTGELAKRIHLNASHSRWKGEHRGAGPFFAQPGLSRISFIGQDGHGYSVDRSSGAVQDEGETLNPGRVVGFKRAVYSQSRGVVYLVSGPELGDRFDQINCLAADTLATRATLSTSAPFFSLAMSSDGSHLYAVSPERSTVTVIDPVNMRELRHFSVGQRPIFVLAVP
jgi:hypothetical protein